MTPSGNLSDFRRTIVSQNGEDGILEEIFRRLGIEKGFCVEFGAWDGKHLSNSWNLWHNQGWSALLIEGDAEKAKVLDEATKNFDSVHTLNAFVTISGPSCLETLLEGKAVSPDFDLLSIDIDGDDYHIFSSLEKFKPRVIVIEFNPSIPPELEFVQPKGGYFGSSALALCVLAKTKGYRLACVTDCNCIFVRQEDFPQLGIEEPVLSEVFPRQYLTYVITSFGGQAFLNHEPIFTSLRKLNLISFLRELGKRILRPRPRVMSAEGGQASLIPAQIFSKISLSAANARKETRPGSSSGTEPEL